MGTRALTIFTDEGDGKGGEEIAVLYNQYDGYPSGHGKILKEILQGPSNTFNGMADLAVRTVAKLKIEMGVNKPGNYYLYPAGTRNVGEEFRYFLSMRGSKIMLKITPGEYGEPRTIYEGPMDDFDPDKED